MILSQILSLPITKWKYKGTEEFHIGPMAEDFYDSFKVGIDNTAISTVNASGIALIAIQELAKENKKLKENISKQQKELDELKIIINKILNKDNDR